MQARSKVEDEDGNPFDSDFPGKTCLDMVGSAIVMNLCSCEVLDQFELKIGELDRHPANGGFVSLEVDSGRTELRTR